MSPTALSAARACRSSSSGCSEGELPTPTQLTSTSRALAGSWSTASATALFSTIALAANATASAQAASATPNAATDIGRQAAADAPCGEAQREADPPGELRHRASHFSGKLCLAVPNARIERSERDIREQVGEDDRRRQRDCEANRQRIVTCTRSRDEVAPDAGDRERPLDHEQAGDEAPDQRDPSSTQPESRRDGARARE